MKSETLNFIETDEMGKQLFATACKVANEMSERLELVEEFKEELKRLNRVINRSMNGPYFKKYYFEYVRLGGKSEKKKFKIHLRRFFELTFNIYIYGSILNIDGTYCDGRQAANKKWILYIGSYKEAKLYKDAVDNITPYTLFILLHSNRQLKPDWSLN